MGMGQGGDRREQTMNFVEMEAFKHFHIFYFSKNVVHFHDNNCRQMLPLP